VQKRFFRDLIKRIIPNIIKNTVRKVKNLAWVPKKESIELRQFPKNTPHSIFKALTNKQTG
jgi:hypothetical protein